MSEALCRVVRRLSGVGARGFLSVLVLTLLILPTQGLWADDSKVEMSASVVTPTNLFTQVAFTGWSVPYGKVVLYDTGADKVYIQAEMDDTGDINLPFVLAREADTMYNFDLYAEYKGLKSQSLRFNFSASTYDETTTKQLVLPPLVELSQTEITTAQEVRAIAYACRGCDIEWTITSPAGHEEKRTVQADDYGYAEVSLAIDWQAGEYTLRAVAKREGALSPSSTELVLTVRAVSGGGGTGTGEYAFVPGAIVISGLEEMLANPWVGWIMVALFGLVSLLSLRTLVDLISKSAPLGSGLLGLIPVGWLWGWDRHATRCLTVYRLGEPQPLLSQKMNASSEPFHLHLPAGAYRVVWDEPRGIHEETILEVDQDAPVLFEHPKAQTPAPAVAAKPVKQPKAKPAVKSKPTPKAEPSQPDKPAASKQPKADEPKASVQPAAKAAAKSEPVPPPTPKPKKSQEELAKLVDHKVFRFPGE